MPANRVRLAALFDTLIAGVSVHIRFLAVQETRSARVLASPGSRVKLFIREPLRGRIHRYGKYAAVSICGIDLKPGFAKK